MNSFLLKINDEVPDRRVTDKALTRDQGKGLLS